MGFRNMYISASAGSGKTYQLVNRFLALLCLQKLERGVDVSRIIAITFTRKAAGEFRGRILSALAQGATDAEAARSLWRERILPTIADESYGILPSWSIKLPQAPELFFRDLLADVMRQFPKLNLGTIDSLFQRMVSALAYELGLSSFENLSGEKESGARRKALKSTYRGAENSPELCEAIMDSVPDAKALSRLDDHLYELVRDYHKPALDSAASAWGGREGGLGDEALAAFGTTHEEVTPDMSEEEYLGLVGRMGEVLEQIDEKARGRKGLEEYLQKLTSFKVKLEAKSSKIWQEYFAKCADAGIDVEKVEKTRRAFIWKKLLQRTSALRRLLDEYENNYHEDVRAHGLFTFDDVPRLLAGHCDAESIARISERTDAGLEHWLLDEFQDTGHNQYDILRDLLESRAQGDDEGSVLMVGDAKQSIYQFRGGDPRLFIDAREKLFGLKSGRSYPQGTEYSAEQQLNNSYRSAQAVLDMANDLFLDIDRTAQCAVPQARALWKKMGYGRHTSGPGLSRKLGQGCAQVWQANKTGTAEGRNVNVYRTIAHLLAQARPLGAKRKGSCAILVRTGKQGTDLANALHLLREEFPFEGELAVCNDKMVGHDSPLGQALLQLFCWLDNPADVKNLGLLKLTPLWIGVTNEEDWWQELNTDLASGGVSAVLGSLSPRLQDILSANEFLHQRWKTWIDEASAFDAQGGTLSDWIQQIRGVTVREEPQGDVIQIMTIHKAKGLEFDMVLLPVFSPSTPMANYRNDKVSLLCRRDGAGNAPVAMILPPPRDKGVLEGMAAQTLAEAWQADMEFAGFCELYVAVTRAKRATYVIHPHIAKPEEYLTPGGKEGESFTGMMVQLAALHRQEGDAPTAPDAVCTYAIGDNEWWEALPPVEVGGDAPAGTPVAENYTFAALPRRTPSSMDKDRVNDEEPSLPQRRDREGRTPRLRDWGGADFGTAVHACFEKIAWLQDGEEPALPAGGDARVLSTLHRALSTPCIAIHFRQPQRRHRLYREQNFEALYKGSWISGQIDRLVVEYEGERPLCARIYDYKTDAEPDAGVLASTYRNQMNAYRRIVSLAFGLPTDKVSVTLLHVSASCPPEAIPVEA